MTRQKSGVCPIMINESVSVVTASQLERIRAQVKRVSGPSCFSGSPLPCLSPPTNHSGSTMRDIGDAAAGRAAAAQGGKCGASGAVGRHAPGASLGASMRQLGGSSSRRTACICTSYLSNTRRRAARARRQLPQGTPMQPWWHAWRCAFHWSYTGAGSAHRPSWMCVCTPRGAAKCTPNMEPTNLVRPPAHPTTPDGPRGGRAACC